MSSPCRYVVDPALGDESGKSAELVELNFSFEPDLPERSRTVWFVWLCPDHRDYALWAIRSLRTFWGDPGDEP